MPPTNLPLRWESTGDQWWFASPIDWAAANGHYDLVRELLHLDTNLIIKLTSLPRIRRLETVWDDDENFNDVATCRSRVARKLFQECETNKGQNNNSLIRAGYGGWLLYTAAAAGDVVFVRELLDRDPFLVFGEGEYGVTDMLYAAARSKNCDVFRMLFACAISPKGQIKEVSSVFKENMMNRAMHAVARGGNVEVLRDFLGDGGDVFAYRDARGSTVLHTAAGRGQVEVVKHLISSYGIINSVDNRGNTALHVAAYSGHLAVVEVLLSASPSSASLTNDYGDTFLHMAVSGFCSPSFRRLDRQIDLMKRLVSGDLINIEELINIQNNDGRTALHLAVIGNIQSEIMELIMSIRCVNLNIRDADENTALDILKQRPQSASSASLIKQLISAGGISDQMARNSLVSHLRMRGNIGPGSPGTSFRIPDGEILLYSGTEDLLPSSCELTSSEYGYSGEIRLVGSTTGDSSSSKYKKSSSMNNPLKMLLRWPGNKADKNGNRASDFEDNYSIDSDNPVSISKIAPAVPLRQRFSSVSSLPNNKRVQSLPRNLFPSPSAKKKFAAGLSHGVLQVQPGSYLGSPSSAVSESSWSSPVSADKRKDDGRSAGPSTANQSPGAGNVKMKLKHGSFNLRLMNSYLCFGAHDLAVDNSLSKSTRQNQNHQQHSVLV